VVVVNETNIHTVTVDRCEERCQSEVEGEEAQAQGIIWGRPCGSDRQRNRKQRALGINVVDQNP